MSLQFSLVSSWMKVGITTTQKELYWAVNMGSWEQVISEAVSRRQSHFIQFTQKRERGSLIFSSTLIKDFQEMARHVRLYWNHVMPGMEYQSISALGKMGDSSRVDDPQTRHLWFGFSGKTSPQLYLFWDISGIYRIGEIPRKGNMKKILKMN